MRKLLIFPFVFTQLILIAQTTERGQMLSRIIIDEATHFQSEYQIDHIIEFNVTYENNTLMHIPYLKGSGYLQQKGKPALPSFSELFAVSSDSIILNFISIESDTLQDILIYPWIGHAVDLEGTPSPEFFMDSAFYKLNTNYPSDNAEIADIQIMRSLRTAIVRICPFTYNPATKTLVIHKRFIVEMKQYEPFFFRNNNNDSPVWSSIYSNIIINKGGLKEFYSGNKDITTVPNYLIFTHTDYIEAAKRIAEWREQTGYNTEIISSSTWLSASIKQFIHDRYYSQKRPSYILLLGDHNKVPGNNFITNLGVFPIDRAYVHMDGTGDYFPDNAIGRISVNSEQQALEVAEKIILYEKNPFLDPGFYNKALSVAYFQDDNNDTYADRRFAQTAEEILQYLSNQAGKNVERIYYSKPTVTPLFWNNGSYSSGEPLPSYLLKPGFPWNGNNNDIISHINSGAFLVYHRDHGSVSGWADPAFNITNVQSLNNVSKLPVVASVNCQTGKFLIPECFAEAFLRHSQGGATGVFAHAEVSFSGYNDALAMGIIDAIFAQPGLIPNFTGSGHVSSTMSPHIPILTLGDVANQALLRMVQTWGDSWGYEQYQHHIFHYFGDPATRIFTHSPVVINAAHQFAINCNDSLFVITSCNIPDALATLTADGKLIGITTLQNGSGTIFFKPSASNQIILTVSAKNSKPYIQQISSSGNCVFADFEVTMPSFPCVSHDVVFENRSSGYYSDLIWEFGPDAIPNIITGTGPHSVHFITPGYKSIKLTAISPFGNDSMIHQIFINPLCNYAIPVSGISSIQSCSGILKDNGYDYPYLSNSHCQTVITSPGASQIQLSIMQFDVKASAGCDDSYLKIYSGNPITGTLIGQFCNSNAPPSQLFINNDTVWFSFFTNHNPGHQGFEITWECIQPAIPPVAELSFTSLDHCGSIIQFFDHSLYQPVQWKWDFGDGNTSTEQNPVHEYFLNGTYDIQLIVTNQSGNDTIIQSSMISVYRPQHLNDSTFSICRSGNVLLSGGNGQNVFWYDSNTSLLPFAYTDVLTFFADQAHTDIYCRNYITSGTFSGGKLDNAGAGGYLNSSVIHFLGFDVYQPLNLKAVTVYAQDNGNRTIRIRDGNNNIVYTSTHLLTIGENRIVLDYILLPDNDYKIDAGQNCKLFRNGQSGGNILDYPFIIPGFLAINRSSAGYPDASKYYYYFYDWEIESLCLSAPAKKEIRVEIADTTISAWPGISLCAADSILLTLNTNGTNIWLPNGDTTTHTFVTQPGNYFAIIENNGCVANSQPIIIDGEIFPFAEFTYTVNGLEVIFSNSSTGASYNWDFGDGNESQVTNPVHTYAQTGTYMITLVAQNICGSDTTVFPITLTDSGINSLHLNILQIFPNPADESILIDLGSFGKTTVGVLNIFNSSAQLIYSSDYKNSIGTNVRIPVDQFSTGMYFVIIQTDNDLFFGKFVKTNF